jgi:hypothetical protein
MSNRRKPPRSIYEQPQGFVDDIPDDEFFNSQLVMAAEALERKMQDTPPPPMTAPVTSSHVAHSSSNVSGSANSAPLSYHTTSAYHASSASSASSGFASSNVSSMNSMNAHSSMRTSRASVQTTTPVYTSKPPTPTIPDAAFDTVMQPSDLSKEASSSESSAASATSHNAHVGTTMTPANPVPPNASQLNPNEREQFLSAIEALQTQMKQKDYSIICAQGELEVLRRRAATAEKERFDVLKQLKSQKYVPSSSTVGASNMSSSSATGNTAASVALSASGASQMDALKKKIEQLETQLAFKDKDIAELQSFQSVGQRSQPPSATKSSNNMLRITQTQPGASMVRSLEDSEIMHDVVPATLSSSVSATPRGSSSSRRPTPSKYVLLSDLNYSLKFFLRFGCSLLMCVCGCVFGVEKQEAIVMPKMPRKPMIRILRLRLSPLQSVHGLMNRGLQALLHLLACRLVALVLPCRGQTTNSWIVRFCWK